MNVQNPTVTIRSTVNARQVTTKNGQLKTIYSQQVQVETEQMRVQTEHEIDSPDKALPVGAVYAWDVTQDLVPGRFGIELARRMTLVEPAKPAGKGQ